MDFSFDDDHLALAQAVRRFCDGEFSEITNAAEALVTRVIEDGGKVEVIDDHPKIAEFGVGALLRY